jgi:hypothetical protein
MECESGTDTHATAVDRLGAASWTYKGWFGSVARGRPRRLLCGLRNLRRCGALEWP